MNRETVYCKECGSALSVADRFCPACGTPNLMARFHPKLDRGTDEKPIFEIIEVDPGAPTCPRCTRPVAETDTLCAACGMDLTSARTRHRARAAVGVWRTAGRPLAYPYRSVRGLATVLRPILIVGMGVAVVAAGADLWLHERLDVGRFAAGPSDATLEKAAQVAAAVLAGLVIGGTILFAIWLARAYRNLPAMGVSSLRFGLGWAVAAWLVPLWNLWRPKQLLDDCWRASDPACAPGSPVWRLDPVPLWSAVWWVTAVLGAAVSVPATLVLLSGLADVSRADATLALFLGALGSLLLGVAALALFGAVTRTTERQDVRADLLGAPTDRHATLAALDDERDGEPEGDGAEVVDIPVFSAPRSREDVAGRY